MFYAVSSRRQDGDIAIRYVSDVGIDLAGGVTGIYKTVSGKTLSMDERRHPTDNRAPDHSDRRMFRTAIRTRWWRHCSTVVITGIKTAASLWALTFLLCFVDVPKCLEPVGSRGSHTGLYWCGWMWLVGWRWAFTEPFRTRWDINYPHELENIDRCITLWMQLYLFIKYNFKLCTERPGGG